MVIDVSIQQGVSSCLQHIYGLNPNTDVLFIIDNGRKNIYDEFYNIVRDITPKIKMINLDSYPRPLTKIPDSLEKIVENGKPGLCINLFESIPEETPTRIDMIKYNIKNNILTAHGPGLDMGMLRRNGPFDANYQQMLKNSRKLMKKLGDYERFKVFTGNNNQFELELETTGRQWKTDLDVGEKGFGNIPAGEIFIAPVETSANGKLLIRDAVGWYKINVPVLFEWKDGAIVDIECSNKNIKAKLWDTVNTDETSKYVGELGFGVNKNADPNSDLLEAEKSGLHIAFGPQDDYGCDPKYTSSTHLDLLAVRGTVIGILPDGTEELVYKNRHYPILDVGKVA